MSDDFRQYPQGVHPAVALTIRLFRTPAQAFEVNEKLHTRSYHNHQKWNRYASQKFVERKAKEKTK